MRDQAFAADYRVRFDEAAPDGRIRSSTLLRYAQDVAWRHSEARGFDRDWYAERGLGWVVRGVELEMLRPIAMGATLRVSTAVVGHRRIWARRVAEARMDGELAARVVTDWVILDARGRPVRIPADFGLHFTSPELDDDILRVEPVASGTGMSHRVRVRPADLDPAGHANNAAYLDWIVEALLARGDGGGADPPGSVRLEYLVAAGPGEEIEVATWREGRQWGAILTRVGGGVVLRADGTLG